MSTSLNTSNYTFTPAPCFPTIEQAVKNDARPEPGPSYSRDLLNETAPKFEELSDADLDKQLSLKNRELKKNSHDLFIEAVPKLEELSDEDLDKLLALKNKELKELIEQNRNIPVPTPSFLYSDMNPIFNSGKEFFLNSNKEKAFLKDEDVVASNSAWPNTLNCSMDELGAMQAKARQTWGNFAENPLPTRQSSYPNELFPVNDGKEEKEQEELRQIPFCLPPTLDDQDLYPDIEERISKLEQELAKLHSRVELENKLDQLARVYSLILDGYPNLHPHIRSSSSENQFIPMQNDIIDFLAQNLDDLDDSEKEILDQFVKKIILAIQYEHPYLPEQAAQEIYDLIANLNHNESLILEGLTDGHKFLYRIKKEEENYLFTIINTGQDENIRRFTTYRNHSIDHSLFRPFGPHKNEKYSDKAYLCSLEALNPEFLEMILSEQNRSLKMPQLIQKIDSSLTNFGGKTTHGRSHHSQGRPSCSFKCVTSALKTELIDQLGQERGSALYARFKAFRTKKIIDELAGFEKAIGPDFLKEAYQVSTDEDLHAMQLERDTTIKEVYEKRLQKACKLSASSSQDIAHVIQED